MWGFELQELVTVVAYAERTCFSLCPVDPRSYCALYMWHTLTLALSPFTPQCRCTILIICTLILRVPRILNPISIPLKEGCMHAARVGAVERRCWQVPRGYVWIVLGPFDLCAIWSGLFLCLGIPNGNLPRVWSFFGYHCTM